MNLQHQTHSTRTAQMVQSKNQPAGNSFFFLILITLVIILSIAPELFHGQTFSAPDLYAQNNPRHVYLANALRHGRVPLWCPEVETGSSFAGDGASGLFYPPTLIFLLAPVGLATGIYIALHLLMAAIFMYLLCRHFRIGHEGAVLGAAIFALGGAQLAHVEHTMYIAETAWLPLILLLVDIAVTTRRAKYVCLASAVMAMHCTPAFPPVIMYVMIAAAVMVLWRRDAGLVRIPVFIAICVLAFAVAALPLILTFRQVLLSSHGAGRDISWFLSGSFSPIYLVQTVFPFFFGKVYTQHSWWPESSQECVFYIGVMSLFLIALSFKSGRSWQRGFAVFLLLAGLFLALGNYNPLYRFLHYIPFFSMGRIPARALLLTTFAGAFLAARGLHFFPGNARWLRRWTERKWPGRILVACLCCIVLATTVVIVAPHLVANWMPTLARMLSKTQGSAAQPFSFYLEKTRGLCEFWSRDAFFAAFAITVFFGVLRFAGRKSIDSITARKALLFAACLELIFFSRAFLTHSSRTAMDAAPPTAKFLQQQKGFFRIYSWKTEAEGLRDCGPNGIAEPNCLLAFRAGLGLDVPIAYGISTIGGYASVPLSSYMELYAYPEVRKGSAIPTKSDPPILDPIKDHRILNMLGVRYVVTSNEVPPPYREVYRWQLLRIYENPDVLPRAWIVSGNTPLTSGKDLEYMFGSAFDPIHDAVINAPIVHLTCNRELLPPRLISDSVEQLEIDAPTPCGGWLIVSDAYDPDWRAERNGRPVPLLQANHSMRVVRIEPGENRIQMVYRPHGLNVLIGISLFALGLCWIGMVCGTVLGKRKCV